MPVTGDLLADIEGEALRASIGEGAVLLRCGAAAQASELIVAVSGQIGRPADLVAVRHGDGHLVSARGHHSSEGGARRDKRDRREETEAKVALAAPIAWLSVAVASPCRRVAELRTAPHAKVTAFACLRQSWAPSARAALRVGC
jgi:hypothetical protein